MLLPEHAEFHKIGPKDLGFSGDKKSAMTVDVLRTTNNTGEQLHIQVPVYGDETREELNRKLNFAYSVIQDRLEAENKAVSWRNERQDIMRRSSEASKRNTAKLEKVLSGYTKRKRKENWTEEKWIEMRDAAVKEFKEANAINEAKYDHALRELESCTEIEYTGPQEDMQFKSLPEPEDEDEGEVVSPDA